MKKLIKILFLSLILLSASIYTFGQNSRFGFKGGLNLSNMTVEGNDDSNLKAGFHAGVFNKIGITESFSIQPELLYSAKGFKLNYDESAIADGETQFNLNYIDLPVKLVFNLSRDFEFQLGPYFSYLAGANVDTDAEVLEFFNIDSTDELDRENFNAFEVGLTGGLGFTIDPLVFGFNYNLGLTQVAKDDEPTEVMLGDAKNTVIQVYAGILF
ncbi:MAG TPA: porin family protein [Tangfeifania sp.]|nr:porin family protein [Tangfeifania sp.]